MPDPRGLCNAMAPGRAASRQGLYGEVASGERLEEGGGGRKRREISLCEGRRFRRSESGRKSRPASFEMTDREKRRGDGRRSGE